MHSVLTGQAQAPINAHYSVFVAEIASTTNEALLLEHMLQTARDDGQRLFYLGAALAYYVFQYATSIAAAQAFAQRLIDKEPGAREAYLAMLAKGGSAHPYEAVKAAGVDLATPQPYQPVAERMNRIMDQIEAIELKRGK